jgi:uncharacterized membrane protein
MISSVRLERYFILLLLSSMLVCTVAVAASQRNGRPGFFEFGLLGPATKASEYQYNVTVSQLVYLSVFVANRMPSSEHLRVAMRIGDSTLADEKLPIVMVQEIEVTSGSTIICPFTFTLSQFGLTQSGLYRVLFELYRDSRDSSYTRSWSFTGLWLQTWLSARS